MVGHNKYIITPLRAVLILVAVVICALLLSLYISGNRDQRIIVQCGIVNQDNIRAVPAKLSGEISESRQHGRPDLPMVGAWGRSRYEFRGNILFDGIEVLIHFVNERPVALVQAKSGEYYLLSQGVFQRCLLAWRVYDGKSGFNHVDLGTTPPELLSVNFENAALRYSYWTWVLSQGHERSTLIRLFNDMIALDSRFPFSCECDDLHYDTCFEDFVDQSIRPLEDPAFFDGFKQLCLAASPTDYHRNLQACYFGLYISDLHRARDFLREFYKAVQAEGLESDNRLNALRGLTPEAIHYIGLADILTPRTKDR